jgi:hypothetical protein
MVKDIRITADSWEGIFLFEEEAALALAGQPLPDRLLDDPRVSPEVRFRAASEPDFRSGILGEGTTRLTIARWTWTGTAEQPIAETMDRSVHVEVYKSKWLGNEGVTSGFRVAVGGRSYDLDEAILLVDMLQIGYRLCRAAEFHIHNRRLAERITGK